MKRVSQFGLFIGSRFQTGLAAIRKRPRATAAFLFITCLTLSYQACGPSQSKNQNLNSWSASSTSTKSGVLGVIDGIRIENSQAYLTGYACNAGSASSISVGIYINGQAGIGTYIGQIEANIASEDAILSACNVSSGSFRFRYPIPPSIAAANVGAPLYAHGLLESGIDSLLQASGQFVVPDTSAITTTPSPSPSPAPAPAPAPVPAPVPAPAPAPVPNPTPSVQADIMGTVDGVFKDSGHAYLTGWACAKTVASSVNIHIYLNGPAGSGSFLGAVTANAASEAGVATACSVGGGSYRFQYELTNDVISRFGGAHIFVHGISPVGLGNLLLNNSGAFAVPLPERTFPIYRYVVPFASFHYFTTTAGEFGDPIIYKSEGVGFNMFDASAELTRPIYSCLTITGIMFTPDPNCEGQTSRGLIGYVKTIATPNATRPLYRCVNSAIDHLMTTNADECKVNHYTIESVLGYVP